MSFTVLYVTCPDELVAKELANLLLEQRCVACANIFPIESLYWWQGNVEQGAETVLLLKTRTEYQPTVERRILEKHPYTTPCILHWQVAANAAYEAWIYAETEPM
mgnify:FL=1